MPTLKDIVVPKLSSRISVGGSFKFRSGPTEKATKKKRVVAPKN